MSSVSTETIHPRSIAEIVAAVRQYDRLLPVGNRTKPPLSSVGDAASVSIAAICGIIQYEPSEFTFTALAGTPVKEIAATLHAKRQYLPFDPPMVDAGATLGGMVAAGLSGPGRFRYGGVRDFLLGVQFVSGDGEVIRAGGKVVKNSAGFDIPKLMVGSLGRLGILTELTFKVFPKPAATLTLCCQMTTHQQALAVIAGLANSRYEFDAIDYRGTQKQIYVRLAGDPDANQSLAVHLQKTSQLEWVTVDNDSADQFWNELADGTWYTPDSVIVKVPTTPESYLALQQWSDTTGSSSIHLSVAGAVTWIAIDSESLTQLHTELCKLQIPALAIGGNTQRAWWGHRESFHLHQRVQQAMDPARRFV
ncbi:MAG: FAD-binding protein [Pirellulaceae bacterium]|nr:FAD-binding protein [Pirellulaceae bacterium]